MSRLAALNCRVAGSGSRHRSSAPGRRKRWNTRMPASSTAAISGASDSTSASKIVLPTIRSATRVISRLMSTSAPSAQPGAHVLGGVDHDVAVAVDVLAAEDRLDRPPAAQVVGALARQQAVAEQAPGRLQRAPLDEGGVVVDEHAAHELGVADEEEAVAAGEAHVGDAAVVGREPVHRARADRAGSGRSSPTPSRAGRAGAAARVRRGPGRVASLAGDHAAQSRSGRVATGRTDRSRRSSSGRWHRRPGSATTPAATIGDDQWPAPAGSDAQPASARRVVDVEGAARVVDVQQPAGHDRARAGARVRPQPARAASPCPLRAPGRRPCRRRRRRTAARSPAVRATAMAVKSGCAAGRRQLLQLAAEPARRPGGEGDEAQHAVLTALGDDEPAAATSAGADEPRSRSVAFSRAWSAGV